MSEDQLPQHKCGLYLTHNQHKDYYEKLESYIEDREEIEFESASDRDECLKTDSFWELQWYPDTPVGSYCVYGPTLERVLELARLIK